MSVLCDLRKFNAFFVNVMDRVEVQSTTTRNMSGHQLVAGGATHGNYLSRS